MSFIKFFYGLILMSLAGVGCYFITNKTPKEQNKLLSKPTLHADNALLHLQGLTLNKPLKKNIHVQIKAEQSTFFKTSKLITCEKLTSTITKKKQKIFFNAEHGIIDQLNNRITFSENFIALLKDAKLMGLELVYNMSTQRLHSNQPTTFSMPKARHDATHCSYDIETETLVMTGGVRTEITR